MKITGYLQNVIRYRFHDRGHEAERSGSGDDTEVRILRDKSVYAFYYERFPEFHYDEMKSRAENVLTSYLQSITGQNPALLSEGTKELKEQLRLRLEMLQNQSQRESFENIHIHRTEIHQYRKQKGRQSIVLQSAVEYIHALKENGKLIGGSEERKEQAKYNVELVYIQDQDMVENQEDAGLALNCPNCGAPLPGLGAKSAFIVIHLLWNIICGSGISAEWKKHREG